MNLKEQLFYDFAPEGSAIDGPEGEIKKYTFVWDNTNPNRIPEWHILAEWENGYRGIITGDEEVAGVKFLKNFIDYLANHC